MTANYTPDQVADALARAAEARAARLRECAGCCGPMVLCGCGDYGCPNGCTIPEPEVTTP